MKYLYTYKILGFYLDPVLSMDDHVKVTVRACNYHIRALRHVRKSLTLEATRTIVHGRDAGTKIGKGAENFKKAHCNYFELKPGFIDAQ